MLSIELRRHGITATDATISGSPHSPQPAGQTSETPPPSTRSDGYERRDHGINLRKYSVQPDAISRAVKRPRRCRRSPEWSRCRDPVDPEPILGLPPVLLSIRVLRSSPILSMGNEQRQRRAPSLRRHLGPFDKLRAGLIGGPAPERGKAGPQPSRG